MTGRSAPFGLSGEPYSATRPVCLSVDRRDMVYYSVTPQYASSLSTIPQAFFMLSVSTPLLGGPQTPRIAIIRNTANGTRPNLGN